MLNGLSLVGKDIARVKLVVSGAGAAALSCLGVLEKLGLPRENMWVTDIAGVVWKGRNELMDPWKERYAARPRRAPWRGDRRRRQSSWACRRPGLSEAEMVGADGGQAADLRARQPQSRDHARGVGRVRDDAIMATGRSDYPNQVNNVLCFPYIFRGALDVGATTVNDEMKIACVRALAELARKEPSEVVARAFGERSAASARTRSSPSRSIPRLIVELAPAVAKAAMDSGVATRPIADFDAYRQQLNQFVFKSGLVMRPVLEQARANPKRVIFSAGEDDRVLRAAQIILDEAIAEPILIGRPEVVRRRAERLGLRFRPGIDAELIDPSSDPRYDRYWGAYHQLMERRGVTEPDGAQPGAHQPDPDRGAGRPLGDADAMIAGAYGRFRTHFNHVRDVIGTREGCRRHGRASACWSCRRARCSSPTPTSTTEPDAETLVDITLLAADAVLRFGIQPKVALLSHSSFGSSDHPSARKMAAAVKILQPARADLEVDGEMHWRCRARSRDPQQRLPRSRLKAAPTW
jgi:malate dehydrogenase (oxaloacetate-decarboxylating)(NADP+)